MTRVRLPRLLDANFGEVRRIQPTAMTANITMRETPSATMAVTDEDIQMHAWMELYTVRGSIGIFRVTDIDQTPRRETSITLRHGIDSLSDDVWAAQEDYDGTVAGFLAQIMAHQTTVRWQLGECDDTGDWKKSGINYSRLSELLWELIEERRGFRFEYDFTTTPWTLSFKSLPATDSAEVRLSRNAEAVQIRRTDSEMCNRLYLSVTSGTTPTLRTFENATSQALYGIISKTASIDLDDVPDADAWAASFLADRASPSVSVSINGYELARLTGETWDELDVGKRCRLVLPSLPEFLSEIIVAVNYPNVLGEPERVTVDLNNHLEKFTETIADMKKRMGGGGGGGGGGGKLATEEEVKAWAKVVTSHGQIIEGTDLQELYESGIVLDAETGVRIYSLVEGMTANRSVIDLNTSDIGLIVQNGQVRADVIVSIVNGSSQISLTADKILLNGETIANEITGMKADFQQLTTGQAEALSIVSNILAGTTLTARNTFVYQSDTIYKRTLKLGNVQSADAMAAGGTTSVDFDHAHALSMDSSGHVTAGAAVAVGDASATFNVAATAWYQQQIAAARQAGAAGVTLSQGGWDGSGNNIVTASNGTTETVALPSFTSSGGTSWSGGATYVYFNTPSVSLPLLTKQVSLPATSAWSASGTVAPPSSSASITVRVGGASRTFTWSGSAWQ